ncbi:hypothetical protein [Microbulbifer sp. SAOS-129_SWC]|uniref:tetratricopeptide repeat protein n=1 Tax=Microbulbifer sp. SAOS-129_SWC TaxID=3145235 RepID=UPI00321724D0
MRAIATLLLGGALLAGCAADPAQRVQGAPAEDGDARFAAVLNRLKTQPDSVPFAEFWRAYLDSSQYESAPEKHSAYLKQQAGIDAGDIPCDSVDWQSLTEQNFVSLQPHLSAQACYESTGNSAAADDEGRVISYLLSGILSRGDGESFDTAYEVAMWDDSEDILKLAGYEVVDTYLQLGLGGQGLYYVVVANDTESGEQKQIVFQNQRVLHQLMGLQFPFAGVTDAYVEKVLKPLSGNDLSAQVGWGLVQEGMGNTKAAAETYLEATGNGSPVAEYHLGLLCLQGGLKQFAPGDCADFLISAAENGFVDALVGAAYVQREGLGVDKSAQGFRRLMRAAQQKLAPGEAWRKLAGLYGGAAGQKNPSAGDAALQRAAELGSAPAQFAVLEQQLRGKQADGAAVLPQMEQLAESGYVPAQVAYARLVLSSGRRSQEDVERLRQLLESATQRSSQSAYNLLGRINTYGVLGKTDIAAAIDDYTRSPLIPQSQRALAWAYLNGEGVTKDTSRAIAWYFLCARRGDAECYFQLGKQFQSGEGRDIETAAGMYRAAAAEGHAGAQARLAQMYERGTGVAADPGRAFQLYSESAQQGNSSASRHLGDFYRDGKQVPRDLGKALQLYEAAAPTDTDAIDRVLSLCGDYARQLSDCADKQRYWSAYRAVRSGEISPQELQRSLAIVKGMPVFEQPVSIQDFKALLKQKHLRLIGELEDGFVVLEAHSTPALDVPTLAFLYRKEGDNIVPGLTRFELLRQAERVINGGSTPVGVAMLDALLQREPHNLRAINDLAWALATFPGASVQQLKNAARLAEQLNKQSLWSQWAYLDTLAAAYARTADFDRAVETQQYAIYLARNGAADEKTLAGMQKRLALFKGGESYLLE